MKQFVILLFIISTSYSQEVLFEKNYYFENVQYAKGLNILKVNDDGFLVSAQFQKNLDSLTTGLVKLNDNFEIEWNLYKFYFRWIILSGIPYIVNTNEFGMVGYYGNLIKYIYTFICDSSGNVTYQIRPEDMEEVISNAGPFTRLKDGSILAISKYYSSTLDTIEISIKKFDKFGRFILKKKIDTIYSNFYNSISIGTLKELSNGNIIYIATLDIVSISRADGFIIILDSTGNKIIKKIINLTRRLTFNDILEDNEGNFIIAGYYLVPSQVNDKRTLFIKKFDNSFNELWEKNYDPTGLTIPYKIIQDKDNCYIISGSTYQIEDPENPGNLYYHYLLKLTKDGERIWDNYWGIDFANNLLYDIIDNNDGNLIVVGYQNKGMYIAKIKNATSSVVNEYDNDKSKIHLSPNPASNLISIKFNNENNYQNLQFKIFDIFGNEVKSIPYPASDKESNEINVDISALGAGVYFIKSVIGSKVEIAKFVKMY